MGRQKSLLQLAGQIFDIKGRNSFFHESDGNREPCNVHGKDYQLRRLGKKMTDNVEEGMSKVSLGDDKETVNIVFIGHVDAGKSTLGGNILVLTGNVDPRTLEKYQQESRELNRESWYLSWALDTSQEERSKGITVEVGRAVRRPMPPMDHP